jgi:hypothetical protein
MFLTIPRKLEDEINSFCKLNEITDINEFLVSCLYKGYTIVKFGTTPKDNFNKENKPLEIEKYEESKVNTEGMEIKTEKRKSRKPTQKEESEPIKEEESIKVKKKIRILKD